MHNTDKRYHWRPFLVATASFIVLAHFYIALFVPPSKEKVWKEVLVEEGMSFKAISAAFWNEGAVRYRGHFELLGRLRGLSHRVRAGYYGLSTNMSMWEVLDVLRRGKIIEYEVVIPEGYNLYQIAWTLAGTPLNVDPGQFIQLVLNKEYVRSLGIEADTLEGYLFPDTYYLPKGTKLEEIPKKMVQRYRAFFNETYRRRAGELGLTEHQVLTLASIVEKEALLRSEEPLISAVYHNRLKKGMRLQADPTAVYGTRAWITNVTKRDLKRKSSYNTYLHKGLPPGPIANPGEHDILAALYPAKVDFLFFVAQGDGSHYFSRDYQTHSLSVKRYHEKKRELRQEAVSAIK